MDIYQSLLHVGLEATLRLIAIFFSGFSFEVSLFS